MLSLSLSFNTRERIDLLIVAMDSLIIATASLSIATDSPSIATDRIAKSTRRRFVFNHLSISSFISLF